MSRKTKRIVPPAGDELIRAAKSVLRKKMRSRIDKEKGRPRKSKSICDAIIANAAWKKASVVALFASLETEPDVDLLWKSAAGKTICYPVMRGDALEFIKVKGPESLVLGKWNVRQPAFHQARRVTPEEIDLILVPGLGFAPDGSRLGRGGGFYDRLLSHEGFHAWKLGVSFFSQVMDEIPTEEHDAKVDGLITEEGFVPIPGRLVRWLSDLITKVVKAAKEG